MREFDQLFTLQAIKGRGASVLQDALEKMAHGFAVFDADLNIVMYSRKFLDTWELTEHQLGLTPNLRQLLRRNLLRSKVESEETVDAVVEQRIARGLGVKDNTVTLLKSPAGRWIENHVCRTEAGRLVVTYSDVTERISAQEELQRLATQDPLTGLCNRRHFLEEANRELEKARRFEECLPVALMDLDHFKSINDSFGHAAGDRALVAVSEALGESTRSTDLLGRIGGEEFAAALPRTDRTDARRLAERIRCGVAEASLPEVCDARLTVSIGVSATHPGEESVEGALARADDALYRAKRNGRNRVEYGFD